MQLYASDRILFPSTCSVSALLMMVTLKRLASTGCTVIFTMYHSSTEVFGLFERICLLANGKMLFFGDTLACLKVCILHVHSVFYTLLLEISHMEDFIIKELGFLVCPINWIFLCVPHFELF